MSKLPLAEVPTSPLNPKEEAPEFDASSWAGEPDNRTQMDWQIGRGKVAFAIIGLACVGGAFFVLGVFVLYGLFRLRSENPNSAELGRFNFAANLKTYCYGAG